MCAFAFVFGLAVLWFFGALLESRPLGPRHSAISIEILQGFLGIVCTAFYGFSRLDTFWTRDPDTHYIAVSSYVETPNVSSLKS